jgi:hypothetical protein
VLKKKMAQLRQEAAASSPLHVSDSPTSARKKVTTRKKQLLDAFANVASPSASDVEDKDESALPPHAKRRRAPERQDGGHKLQSDVEAEGKHRLLVFRHFSVSL